MPLRRLLLRTLAGVLLALTALVSVGITAPADAPFSIVIQPVFLRLGVDVDVKLGSAHFHAGWFAIS